MVLSKGRPSLALGGACFTGSQKRLICPITNRLAEQVGNLSWPQKKNRHLTSNGSANCPGMESGETNVPGDTWAVRGARFLTTRMSRE